MSATAPYGKYSLQLSRAPADSSRVVTVIMALSSLAFYGMAFRVPVVSLAQSSM